MIVPESYLVLDIENANRNRFSICQMGFTFGSKGHVRAVKTMNVNPKCDFEHFHMSLHGITPASVANAKSFKELLPFLISVLGKVPVFHHGDFDRQAIEQCCSHNQVNSIKADWRNSIPIFQTSWPELSSTGYKLSALCKNFDIELDHHDAGKDSLATAQLLNIAANNTHLVIPEQFQPKKVEGRWKGITVVFTGDMNKQELRQLANSVGIEVKENLTGNTNILCIGALDNRTIAAGRSKTIKQETAEKFKEKGARIQIITESNFRELIARHAPLTQTVS